MNLHGLKHLRQSKGLSLMDMALALGLKTAGGYKRIETGENKLKAEHLPIIALKCGVDLNELIAMLFFSYKLDETSNIPEGKLKY